MSQWWGTHVSYEHDNPHQTLEEAFTFGVLMTRIRTADLETRQEFTCRLRLSYSDLIEKAKPQGAMPEVWEEINKGWWRLPHVGERPHPDGPIPHRIEAHVYYPPRSPADTPRGPVNSLPVVALTSQFLGRFYPHAAKRKVHHPALPLGLYPLHERSPRAPNAT